MNICTFIQHCFGCTFDEYRHIGNARHVVRNLRSQLFPGSLDKDTS